MYDVKKKTNLLKLTFRTAHNTQVYISTHRVQLKSSILARSVFTTTSYDIRKFQARTPNILRLPMTYFHRQGDPWGTNLLQKIPVLIYKLGKTHGVDEDMVIDKDRWIRIADSTCMR